MIWYYLLICWLDVVGLCVCYDEVCWFLKEVVMSGFLLKDGVGMGGGVKVLF